MYNEMYFIRGVLLSKLQFSRFGKLYLTDIEEESSTDGYFGLLHVADITLVIQGARGLNKNVNSFSIMNSSKRQKKKKGISLCHKLASCLLQGCDRRHIDFILSTNKVFCHMI